MTGAEIPGMIATLCSYENLFGPYHPQTLGLTAQVANAYWQAGEAAHARALLERVVRDVGRCLGRDHDLRLRAVSTLRDLFVAQHDFQSAEAMQTELLECHTQRLGGDHAETLAARTNLEMIMLAKAGSDTDRTS
jgi:Tetratricopeptide repeat